MPSSCVRAWSGPLRVVFAAALIALGLTAGTAPDARAQAPLTLINEDTQVEEISFRFVDHQTFRERELLQEIALTEPNFLDEIRGTLPLIPTRPHPFDPLTLQRDVVRLRHFYQRQGFLEADISYPATQLDSSQNAIHVIFRIREGPPLIIQDVSFRDSLGQGYAAAMFSGEVRQDWISFRDENTFETGERYTQLKYYTLQADILDWMRNQGFAFASVDADSTVFHDASSIDLRFQLNPGPRARITEIDIEGNQTVSDKVVRRELPFSEGDLFQGQDLVVGQRNLFGLNMFRLVVVDVPSQPQDSTVRVRVRMQEADLRTVTARTGYDTNTGAIVESQWTHRNFFGGARHLTATGVYGTGFGARRIGLNRVQRRLRAAVSLRQPYLFIPNMTGVISPYLLRRNDELLNVTEFGIVSSLIYEIYPYRIASLNYTFSRASDFSDAPIDSLLNEEVPIDVYNKSIFTFTATLGDADNFLSPQNGFIVRPFLETSRPALGSALNYHKLGVETSFYQPITPDVDLVSRLTLGRLYRFGDSQYDESTILDSFGNINAPCEQDPGEPSTACMRQILDLSRLERRFQTVRFYAGGANDIRGWSARLVGDEIAVADTAITEPDEPDAAGDTTIVYGYEPIGGIAKISGSIEFRLPLPLFGPNWGSAVFLDFGQVFDSRGGGNALALRPLRFGTGAGLRYRTVVGYLRVDLGFKINPTSTDLISAEEIYKFNAGEIDEPGPSFWDRFQVHISLGQSF